jgi:undecaprenyl diphosphate synthase
MAFNEGAGDTGAELSGLDNEELQDQIRSRPLPRHVAIIMDGNGRWATRRGLPRVAGHSYGVRAVRETIRGAGQIGLEFLTLYAFSSENWQRPSHEVSTLMSLLERSIDRELPELMENNVQFRVIGRADGVPAPVHRRIQHVVEATAANTGLILLMAFNYGARDEMVDACRRLAQEVKAGTLGPEEIDEKRVAAALYTDGVPDPDLLIRTSGEMRVSNFLLWQIAYAELLMTPTLWPDFGARDLYLAIAEFQRRHRRFGKV